jgi:hypothetical protein
MTIASLILKDHARVQFLSCKGGRSEKTVLEMPESFGSHEPSVKSSDTAAHQTVRRNNGKGSRKWLRRNKSQVHQQTFLIDKDRG